LKKKDKPFWIVYHVVQVEIKKPGKEGVAPNCWRAEGAPGKICILERIIENESIEHGTRVEIYARSHSLLLKLGQGHNSLECTFFFVTSILICY
jgi:hypothetical protein